jgi:nucleotide-binding universal stress UspA family protein
MGAEGKELETIVVATDFSDTGQAGLAWALELAKDHEARIDLVHGLLMPNQMTDFVPSPPDLSEELQQAAMARLNEVAEEARESGIRVDVHLRLGLPSESILEAARELQADLIVMGTRGLSGIRHLLLGSTAERVVQHADCPVLTVHPDDIDQHRSIRTVLVPTDFSGYAQRGVEVAERLLHHRLQQTRLLLLHVYHLPFEYTAYGTIPTSLDYFKDVEGAAAERLEQIAQPLREKGLEVKTLSREGYPPEVITGEAEAAGADLIAMGTHGRSGLAHLLLGSTAERVVQTAPCPVLTVRREKKD